MNVFGARAVEPVAVEVDELRAPDPSSTQRTRSRRRSGPDARGRRLLGDCKRLRVGVELVDRDRDRLAILQPGVPKSVTTTSNVYVPGPSVSLGVHENAPLPVDVRARRRILEREPQHIGRDIRVGRRRRERQLRPRPPRDHRSDPTPAARSHPPRLQRHRCRPCRHRRHHRSPSPSPCTYPAR